MSREGQKQVTFWATDALAADFTQFCKGQRHDKTEYFVALMELLTGKGKDNWLLEEIQEHAPPPLLRGLRGARGAGIHKRRAHDGAGVLREG